MIRVKGWCSVGFWAVHPSIRQNCSIWSKVGSATLLAQDRHRRLVLNAGDDGRVVEEQTHAVLG
jgi:hypothetical protein